MSFTLEKKNQIKHYYLEKLKEDPASAVSKTCNIFHLSKNSVYRYIRELEKDKIIRRNGHTVELIKQIYFFQYHRNKDLDEIYVYKDNIYKYISNLSDNVIRILGYGFSEMMNNAIEHSKCSDILVGIIQDYMSTAMIIHDDGIGIFNSIKSFYNLNSLDDAVAELFKGKLTTDKTNHSGEGIFFTSRMMDNFFAISDQKVFSHNNYMDLSGNINSLSNQIDLNKGTLIYMELSNFSNKNIKEIFDMFSDKEGKFIRTIIPLKHIYDNDPVARSQARKLCFRFEDFSEVVLDFDGITWIGQGFADEIFRVYQAEHPALKFIIKNANEDVNKMINHVKN